MLYPTYFSSFLRHTSLVMQYCALRFCFFGLAAGFTIYLLHSYLAAEGITLLFRFDVGLENKVW